MSTIYKCDKCGKIIKNNHNVHIYIRDIFGVLGKKLFSQSFELCEKCAELYMRQLTRIFPELKINKK